MLYEVITKEGYRSGLNIMAFDFSFSDVNWLSVIVSALAAFAVGSLWYSPLMVGKRWQKEVGLSDESMKNANMGMIFGGAFVLNVIGAIALELLIGPESTAFKRNNFV